MRQQRKECTDWYSNYQESYPSVRNISTYITAWLFLSHSERCGIFWCRTRACRQVVAGQRPQLTSWLSILPGRKAELEPACLLTCCTVYQIAEWGGSEFTHCPDVYCISKSLSVHPSIKHTHGQWFATAGMDSSRIWTGSSILKECFLQQSWSVLYSS